MYVDCAWVARAVPHVGMAVTGVCAGSARALLAAALVALVCLLNAHTSELLFVAVLAGCFHHSSIEVWQCPDPKV